MGPRRFRSKDSCGEVPVEGDPARRVFVQLAVAVVVAPFGIELVAPPLAFLGIGLDHHAVVAGMRDGIAGGVFHSHRRDPPVSVEILRTVFVDPGVVVFVDGALIDRPFTKGSFEESLGAVGRGARDHVERHPIEDRAKRGVCLGFFNQPLGQAKRDFTIDQSHGFHPANNQHRRLLVAFAGADRERHDLATAERLAERDAGDVLRFGQFADLGEKRPMVAVAVQSAFGAPADETTRTKSARTRQARPRGK